MKAFLIGVAVLFSLVATINCSADAEEYLECFGNKVRDDPAQFMQYCEGVDLEQSSSSEPGDVSSVLACLQI